jgi:hypothetical protein
MQVPGVVEVICDPASARLVSVVGLMRREAMMLLLISLMGNLSLFLRNIPTLSSAFTISEVKEEGTAKEILFGRSKSLTQKPQGRH